MRTGKSIIFLLFVFLCLASVSCDPKYTGTDPSESFVRVYDKPDKSSYIAVDIKQLPDGGYIILAMVGHTPYILKLDKQGEFLWDTAVDTFSGYIDPIPNILVFNREYYFFCSKAPGINMNQPIALLKLIETDTGPGEMTEVALGGNTGTSEYIIPMDAKITPGEKILLLALDGFFNKTVILETGRDGSTVWENDYPFDFVCANTYPVTDKRYHFIELVETAWGSYYNFQSFTDTSEEYGYPYCFGITGTSPWDGSFTGTYIPDTPFIAVDWSGYTAAGAFIHDNTISFFINFPPEYAAWYNVQQSELSESKPVCIKIMNVSYQKLVFFAGSTRGDKIVLYAYDWENGIWVPPNKEYFGFTNIYEAAGMIETADGGLALLGTTYITGRLGRICLFKLSIEDLKDIVGQF